MIQIYLLAGYRHYLQTYGNYPYICNVLTLIMAIQEKTRFDTRLSSKQKELFEMAAQLGGYKTLSEFILSSAQQQADQIMQQHRQILADDADRKTFFKALLNLPKPNAALKKAMARYIDNQHKK